MDKGNKQLRKRQTYMEKGNRWLRKRQINHLFGLNKLKPR